MDAFGDGNYLLLENSDRVPCDFQLVSRQMRLHQVNDNMTINVAVSGGVWDKPYVARDGVDIVMDRTKNRPLHCTNCKRAWFVQGLSFAYDRTPGSDYDLRRLCQPSNLIPQSAPEKFALLAANRVAKRDYHFTDVLFRVAVFRELERHVNGTEGTAFLKDLGKPPTAHCGGRDALDSMTQCKRDYRFTLDMENSQVDGYITEKIFTGLMANAVPVYFGALDIGEIINPKRFVHCKVDPEKIEKVRKGVPLKGRPALESLGKFEEQFRDEITDCVKQIQDMDAAAYLNHQVFTDYPRMCSRSGPLTWTVGTEILGAIPDKRVTHFGMKLSLP